MIRAINSIIALLAAALACAAAQECHSACKTKGADYTACTFGGIRHADDLCCPLGYQRTGDGSACDPLDSYKCNQRCHTYGNGLPYDGSPYGDKRNGSRACPSLCEAVPHLPNWNHYCDWQKNLMPTLPKECQKEELYCTTCAGDCCTECGPLCDIATAPGCASLRECIGPTLEEGFIEVDGTVGDLVVQPPFFGKVDMRGDVTVTGTLTNTGAYILKQFV